MQTRSFRTLLEISQVGSFAIAADRLGMTLSAVSMQMKALETELDVSLFDRSHRPPQLTPLGRTIAECAQQLIETEQSVIELCRPDGGLSGSFRIGFIATASVRLLPDFLIQAKTQAPLATFEVETGLSEPLEERVLTGQLDAAVVTATPAAHPGIQYKTLRRENLAFAAPANASANAPEKLIEQLPFLHFMPNSGIGKLIATHVRSYVGRGRQSIVLDSVEAIMECVNKGIGFTLLPEPDIERYRSENSRGMAFKGPAMTRDIVLASSDKNANSSQMKEIERLFAV